MRAIPVLLLAVVSGISFAAQTARSGNQLVTCGRSEVAIIDLDRLAPDGTPRKLWSWTAAGRKDLPEEYHGLFRTTDECKPFDGGRRILITSSSGGVALVDREEDRVVFHGRATNAHSADLLPGGRIAVAASGARDGSGDAIVLFDVAQSGRELWREPMVSGHGIVWDEQRRLVWALAGDELRAYRLADWSTAVPRLEREATIPLPDSGGHDLAPVPGSPDLSITTGKRCWLFDRDRRQIRPHPLLGAHEIVKCISQHPLSGRIAYVQGTSEHWWSLRIDFLKPDGQCPPPGEQVYKVRWLVEGAVPASPL